MRSLLFAVISCAVIGQAHLLFSGDAEWYVWGYGLMAEMFVLSVLLYRGYLYAELREKYIAFIMCSFPLIQSFLFSIGSNSATYMIAFLCLVSCSVVWFFYAIFRRYSFPSDPVDKDHVFIIAKRPASFLGFLISMFGEPFGGYAYLVGDTVFYFHADKLRQMPSNKYDLCGTTLIRTNVSVSDGRYRLAKMLGSKWTWRNNCWTLRHVI